MRAGDAVVLRRMANSANSGGSGGSVAGATMNQQPGTSLLMTQRSQLNTLVVDAVCTPANASLDNTEHHSCHDITTAPYTDNSVL